MKTLILNLAHRHDRWEQIQMNLKPFSFLQIERVEAVDGKLLDLSTLRLSPRTLSSLHLKKPLCYSMDSVGAIGCFLSHQLAWRQVLKEGKGCIILEDDAQIAEIASRENFVQATKGFSQHNFLWLQYFKGKKHSVVPGWMYTRDPSMNGSHAYYLSPRGAKTLLETSSLDLAVDYFLQATFPHAACISVFKQSKSKSDIEHPGESHFLFVGMCIFVVLVFLYAC